jgi:hypothetical protein
MNDSYEMITRCPWCRKVNEVSTNMLSSGGPRPKDVSLCWACGGLARFDDNLALVPMGLEEQTEYLQSTAYQAYLRARQAARQATGR